jgi:hypothetical protein
VTDVLLVEHPFPMRKNQHLSWNFSEKFKLLGISFNLSESDKTLENFTEKGKSVKKNIKLVVLRSYIPLPIFV